MVQKQLYESKHNGKNYILMSGKKVIVKFEYKKTESEIMKRLLGNENHSNNFHFPSKKETQKECIAEENLTLSWQSPLSYRNQSIDLLSTIYEGN